MRGKAKATSVRELAQKRCDKWRKGIASQKGNIGKPPCENCISKAQWWVSEDRTTLPRGAMP